MTTAQKVNLDRALFDPASVFKEPDTVVEHEDLAQEYKVEILRRWVYDAIEMAVAEEEGMGGGDAVAVHTILVALHRLAGGCQSMRTAPNKHTTA
jgi:hypothetical protein